MEPLGRALDPATTALLVIDMQKGFCAPDSRMGRAVGTAAQQAILPGLREVVGWARGRGTPLIWSRQVHLPGDATRDRRRLPSHAARQGFLPCLKGTGEEDFAEGIADLVRPEDFEVVKHRSSVFFQTDLPGILKMLATQVLVVTGCNTEFCVESTVRDAYAHDLDVVVLEDCVAGIRPDLHRAALEVMGAFFATLATREDLP